MVEDVIQALGYVALGSRLKRLGERLQADTQELTSLLAEINLPTPHNPVLAALHRSGPMSIGDLAASLGQSQPGVTRMVSAMKKAGLVTAAPDTTDKRVSKVALTTKGRSVTEHLSEVLWPSVDAAVADACANLSGCFLEQLDQLDTALSSKPLRKRIRVRVKAR
ncbi:MarR family transcriptional regulator [uncultured Roseibium sp.]|uniref:MarR family winged helix-turn-helix transcriptional regulator n=1 Tax=uncultured Roseibium sp. TaxID=1936171 RepID=UPI00259649EE|nr:MarR family transcriptional regulator [uncultured Roseibium sp.]